MNADFYSDEDLDAFPDGRHLASSYNLIVFAGHEEYVTQHTYSIVARYRYLGGNLAFLSANNFFARVRIESGRMTCIGHFRDFGKPEAQLVGAQYVGWYRRRYRNRPYIVRSVSAAPWLFDGTGLRVGDTFGFSYGVEIDAVEGNGDELLNGMRFAGADDEILGLVVLKHQPHGPHIIAGEAPIALGLQVAQT